MSRATRVLVTGASGGIGAAIAEAYAEEGAHVVLAARRESELEKRVASIRRSGGTATAIPLDITDRSACEFAVAKTVELYGGLDVLINNAGYLGPRVSIEKYDSESLLRSLEVNVLGTFQMIQAALPVLRDSTHPRILSMSSYLGRHGLPDCVGYIAGKFGVEGLTQALHAELEGTSIIPVSLAPGMVATEMLRTYLGQEDVSEFRSPREVGLGVVRMAESLTLEHAGHQLEIDPWLEG